MLAVTAFSWGFILVKVLPLPATSIAVWRLAIGAGALIVAAIVLRVAWPRRWLMTAVAGATFAVHQLLFIEATQRTSVAIVTLVGAMQPLLVTLVSRRTVGEAVSWRLMGCTLLALGGVLIVVQANLDDPSRSLAGDVLSFVNLLAFTAYFLATKRARQEGAPTLTLTAGLLGVAFLLLLPVALLVGGRLAVTPVELGLLAVLALGPGNGHLLVNWAHRRVSAALSSLALAAVPVLSSVWAWMVLGEPFGVRHVIGMGLVVASIEGGRRAEGRLVRDRAAPRL